VSAPSSLSRADSSLAPTLSGYIATGEILLSTSALPSKQSLIRGTMKACGNRAFGLFRVAPHSPAHETSLHTRMMTR
jgi:hypothetical protein